MAFKKRKTLLAWSFFTTVWLPMASAATPPCDKSQLTLAWREEESRFLANGKKEFYRAAPTEVPAQLTKDSGLMDELLLKGTAVEGSAKAQMRVSLKGVASSKNPMSRSFALKPFAEAPGYWIAEGLVFEDYVQKLFVQGGGAVVFEALRQQNDVICRVEIAVEMGHGD
jgi:hypothetical protein